MANCAVKVTCETSPAFDEALRELKSGLELQREGFAEAVQLFVESGFQFCHLAQVNVQDSPAASAGEIRLILEPSQALLDFLATFAGQFDGVMTE